MTPAPAPPPPPPAQFALVPGLERIHFEFDSAELPARETRILDANARWLREHPDLLLLIEGHCDERGTAEYNLALGERRARAARDYLVSREVAPERVAIVSYGKERPLCAERNDACWRLNRRADFLVKPR
jgi:peptidoglycan-associated lipoprotein